MSCIFLSHSKFASLGCWMLFIYISAIAWTCMYSIVWKLWLFDEFWSKMKFLQHVVKFARQILFGFFWNFSHVTMRGTLYINSITSQKMLASNSFSSIPKKCVENNVENMYIGGRIFRLKKLSVFKTLAPFQITHLVTNSHIKCLHVHLIL